VIRRLLLSAAVLVLAGCGSGGGGTRPATTSVREGTAKKLAIVTTLRRAAAAQGLRNVPGARSGCEDGSAPAFSPSDRQIAFAGGSYICLARRDGSHIRPLRQASVDSAFELAWVSPAQLLVDDDYVIRFVPLNGAAPQKFAKPIEAPDFSLAANDSRFATGTQSDCPGCLGQAHVWTIQGKLVGTIGDAHHFYDAPALSPNGDMVAYVQDNAIWVADANGSGARKLVANGGAPLWSPTSDDEIAYVTSAGLWVVSVRHGSPRLVASGAGDNGGWSHDGKFVAYWDFNGLKVVTVGNGKVRSYPLVGFPDNGAPAWSPDSRDLLLIGARFTQHCTALWDQPVNGAKPQLLSSCF
jgi:Tol biopolymer transport system component